MNHQLVPTESGGQRCQVCGGTWKRGPQYSCPGVPVYAWGAWPEHLLTKKQMGEAGFQTGRQLPPPAGAVYRSKSPDGIMWLYDRSQGVPKKPVTDEQRAALKAASAKSQAGWVCSRCGQDHVVYTRRGWARRVYRWPPQLCVHCRDYDKAVQWARDLLSRPDGFVILDSETTGLSPYTNEIIQLAVLDSRGDVLLDTLIRPQRPERMFEAGDSGVSAYNIHGIHPDTLKDAPTFPDIYPQLRAALAGRVVVTYNADFDYSMVAGECERHLLEPVESEDVYCAMVAYSQYAGDYSSYWGNYRWQALPGGSHSALSDCRAVLALIQRMAQVEEKAAEQ
jgi:DNA polymerase-3 subunit epsilon